MPWATTAAGVGCLKAVGLLYALGLSAALPVWAAQQNPLAGLCWTVAVFSGWIAVVLWRELRRIDRESV
jgi:hypothetical protein